MSSSKQQQPRQAVIDQTSGLAPGKASAAGGGAGGQNVQNTSEDAVKRE